MSTSDPRDVIARIKAQAHEDDVSVMDRKENGLLAMQLREDLDRLTEALESVLDMHRPVEGIHCHLVCAHRYCVDEALDQRRWPCPTYTAIETALTEEEQG